MVRNVVRNSPTHLASSLVRLVGRDRRRNTAPQNPLIGVSDIHVGPSLGVRTQHCKHADSRGVICSRHATHFSPEMSLTAMSKRE